jgi:hypothetical protein
MSFYTLAIYFWSAVATLGLTAPLIALAVEAATEAVGAWLSGLRDDEPVMSSHPQPLSVP